MSVVPSELMNDVWTQWQGHVIHDVFRLGRYLGCSDHSGVFLTHSASLGSSDVAIKLVPADRFPAQTQLPLWRTAGDLDHPHLLKPLQWGECQLDGLPYLYVVMEYADQTLAQLLQRRVLTDDEAREMLGPILDALAFLHGQNLVQGQLRPENILVVGDQLKLASDTVRPVGESTIGANAPTAYDPPEVRSGNSTAGDIWALGVCLSEALTRRAPADWRERSEAVALPVDFSPAFRTVVERCLHLNPQYRPSAANLRAWVDGQDLSPIPAATISPHPIAVLNPTVTEPPPPRIVAPPASPEAARPTRPVKPRGSLTAVLAGIVILGVGWAGVNLFNSHRTQAPPPALEGSISSPTAASAPVTADVPKPAASALPPPSGQGELATASTVHEVIPEVSRGTRRKIRGRTEVSVRVVIDPDGSVISATADRIGRSRSLSRLAAEAARKWTFTSSATESRRVMQIRFDFSRDETTAHAVP
jgi:outer membrane biosynthesis protein TonB